MKQTKFAQRQTNPKGHTFSVCLTGNIGYISITDSNLYPDKDSRSDRMNMGFNTIMIPLMTREDLKDLHAAIGEVLKNSK